MTDIYIIFDSPPGDGPSNFVEVEDGDGNGLSPDQTGATWQKLGDQSWALGPFASATLARDLAAATKVVEAAKAWQEADAARSIENGYLIYTTTNAYNAAAELLRRALAAAIGIAPAERGGGDDS